MGNGASSGGAASTSLAGRPGNSASASSDYPSPKQTRHVVIHATDPKRGGLMDKLRQRASLNNGPGQPYANSNTGSRATSQAGSQVGSQVVSERIPRNGKRDDYDVDSDDEDLDGFIYDDDSTSEDEREDYVNAFGRKKKAPAGDDYSNYEGAAVRALATGLRKSRIRRTSSSRTDDGDDEWDPEEERIRQLRHQKKQEDRAKAAMAAKHAGPPPPAKGAAGPGQGISDARTGPSPVVPGASATPAVATSSPAQRTSPQGLQAPHPARITPQPPGEPPSRGSSGSNMRRNIGGASAGGSSHSSGCGLAISTGLSPGPGPGPGPGSGLVANNETQGRGAVAAVAAAPAARGSRPAPPPPPQVNYGASASSQYWQAKRSQNDSGGGAGEPAEQGMSRLEQLAALQKKRQTTQEQSRASEADQRQGALRGQDAVAEPSLTGGQPQPAAVPTGQRQAGTEQVREQTAVCVMNQGGGATAVGASERQSGGVSGGDGGQDVGGKKWDPLGGQPCGSSGSTGTASSGSQQQQQQQQEVVAVVSPPPVHFQEAADPGPAQRKLMDGQSFIRHLEPPPRRHVRKGKSGVGRTDDTTAAAALEPAGPPHPPLLPRCSDAADFDVDEMLNSFSPSGGPAGAKPQEPQQWAGSRPQPAPRTPPPGKDDGGSDHASLHKRSIRAVQSDFTSMGLNDMADGVTDLAGRVLSLPLPATRPTATGPQSVLGSSPPIVTSAPVAMSRFARMGATMLAQSGAQEGGGMTGAPLAVAGGRGGPTGQSPGGGGTAAPTQSAFSGASQVGGPSPMRRPRRSTASSDGTCAPIPTSLSAPPSDTIPSVSGAGNVGAQGQSRVPVGFATYPPSRMSVPGDNALVLPVIRPGSGGGGGGGGAARGPDISNGGSSILNVVGRSRFGAAQHQQFQQEVARSSLPVMPTKRDYDSDSALTKAVTTASRFSYNGAGRGQVAAESVAPGSVYESTGVGVFGAAARSRLGQVGA